MIRRGARISLACLAVATFPYGTLQDDAWAAAGRWFVGEKVVCINNRFLYFSDAPELSEGAVYTIRQILPPRHGYLGLAIDEAPAKQVFQAFDERRFRPFFGFAGRGAAPAAALRSPSDT